jgi:hypothetical protein
VPKGLCKPQVEMSPTCAGCKFTATLFNEHGVDIEVEETLEESVRILVWVVSLLSNNISAKAIGWFIGLKVHLVVRGPDKLITRRESDIESTTQEQTELLTEKSGVAPRLSRGPRRAL